MERYTEVKKAEPVSAADMKLPWAELFATFEDDFSDRALTTEEREKCSETRKAFETCLM